MSRFHACTIVSNNYLAYARVWALSFLEQHPDAELHVLIVDRPHEDIDYDDQPFSVRFADQIDIPLFPNFSFRYSILEINTAVKPFFLERIHRDTGCASLCYFDPDILVTGTLDSLYETLRKSDVVLTPHILRPIEDRAKPSERDFLYSGINNLGFLGISFNEDTLRILRWWQRRLWALCLHRIHEGLFVDQKWADLFPSFLDRTTILRDPTYNMAYWNLIHRQLEGNIQEGWTVQGAPLRFFHFSGLMLEDPDRISKYQDRYGLDDRPDVREIFAYYCNRLLEEKHPSLQEIPYGWDEFSDGIPIPPIAREILRREDPEGKRWKDPFAVGEGSFRDFLTEPLGDVHPPLSRLAVATHAWRDDLVLAFPDPQGEHRDAYNRWFNQKGLEEMRIDSRLVAPSPLGEPPTPAPSPLNESQPPADSPEMEQLRAELSALRNFHQSVTGSSSWHWLQKLRRLVGRDW